MDEIIEISYQHIKLNGKLKISRNSTLRQIKSEIENREGIPIGQQSLYFNEKELLDDSLILIQCGITNGSVLTLVLRIQSNEKISSIKKGGWKVVPIVSGTPIVNYPFEGSDLTECIIIGGPNKKKEIPPEFYRSIPKLAGNGYYTLEVNPDRN